MVVERVRLQSEQHWRELPQRKIDLTASVIAAPLGLHPFVSPAQIYAEKSGRALPTRKETSVLTRGKRLEPLFLPLLRAKFPDYDIAPANEYLREPENQIGCTPDVYMYRPDGALVTAQLKTVGRGAYRRNWINGPPRWVVLQALTEAMLADAVEAIIVVMVVDEWSGFDEIEVVETIPRHPTSEARLRSIAREFRDAIAERRQPAFDFLRDAKLIAALWPETAAGKTVDLGADNELPALLDEYERLVAEITVGEQRKNAIAAEVRAKMEDAEVGVIGGWLITLRDVLRKAHQVKESKFRQLRIRRVE